MRCQEHASCGVRKVLYGAILDQEDVGWCQEGVTLSQESVYYSFSPPLKLQLCLFPPNLTEFLYPSMKLEALLTDSALLAGSVIVSRCLSVYQT